ncbi:MAG: hypothetical protein KDN20_04235 [Verrucomicrobiae bacterium]|nr:hypothetical protein [Verrucomicrobiae bacterium]
MNYHHASVAAIATLWLTFVYVLPSLRSCDGKDCTKKFNWWYCSGLLVLTIIISGLSLYSQGSKEVIAGEFLAENSARKIAEQLVDSIDKLNEGSDASLELEHIRAAMKTEWSDLARWRNELPESAELRILEEKVEELVEELEGANVSNLSETLMRTRRNFWK